MKPADASAQREYTCPMHPQVRQPGPRQCPLCGMSLEPVTAALEAAASPELQDMTRRFWIGLALAVPVFLLEMGGHLFGLHALIDPQASNWVQLVLATPVVFWAGWPFFVRAWASMVNRSLNMFTLVALGTGVAWAYSIVGTIAPQRFPPAFRTMGAAVPIYFEAAASHVDEAMVTGEPMPVAKAPGSKVVAGTINQTGSFVMRADKVGADTLLAQIVRMVSAAQRSHAPIQRLADEVASWFVPVVIGVAGVSFVAWMVWGPAPAFSYALIAAVAVLGRRRRGHGFVVSERHRELPAAAKQPAARMTPSHTERKPT